MRRISDLSRSDALTFFWFRGGKACALLLMSVFLLVELSPAVCWGCACGCGVFEVNTASLFPQGTGGLFYFEYDFMNQYINWHATQPASAGKNNDKVIRTHFLTFGGQYMFNRNWGAMLEVPYWQRYYKGAFSGNNADIQEFNYNSIGDIRLLGMYTGFSEDMSTGLEFGFKVPSGDWHYPHVDRDTQVGTGSTDVLMGAYHLGNLPWSFHGRPFQWYVQGLYDIPFLFEDHYKPGRELDLAVGTDYNFGEVGPLNEFAPIVSLLGSDRARDRGINSDPHDTGYDRLQIAPGIEVGFKAITAYADIEVPIFQNMNGYQLTTPFATKLIVSYNF